MHGSGGGWRCEARGSGRGCDRRLRRRCRRGWRSRCTLDPPGRGLAPLEAVNRRARRLTALGARGTPSRVAGGARWGGGDVDVRVRLRGRREGLRRDRLRRRDGLRRRGLRARAAAPMPASPAFRAGGRAGVVEPARAPAAESGSSVRAARSRCGRLGWIELGSRPRGEARRGWGARPAPGAREARAPGLARALSACAAASWRRASARLTSLSVVRPARRWTCGRDGRGTARGGGAPVARRGEPQLDPLPSETPGWGTPRRGMPRSAPAGPAVQPVRLRSGRRSWAPRRRGHARGWVRRQAGRRARTRSSRARVAAPGPAEA